MCRDFAAREKRIGEPHTLADVAERGAQIASAYQHAIADKVVELEAPSELAAQASRLRTLAREQRDVLRGLADAAAGGDFARARTLASRNAAINAEADAIARQIGAGDCAGRR